MGRSSSGFLCRQKKHKLQLQKELIQGSLPKPIDIDILLLEYRTTPKRNHVHMKAAHAPPLRTHLNLGVSFIKLRSPGACNLLRQSQSWSKWLGVLGAKGSCIQRLQPLRKDMQYSRSWPLRLEETSAVEIPNPDPCSNFDTLGLCLSIVERKLN